MLRRSARLAAWLALGVLLTSAALMAASFWRISWTTSQLHRVEVFKGDVQVLWRGTGGMFNGVSPGWRVGAAPGPLNFSAVGWMRDWHRDWWLCQVHSLTTGTFPNMVAAKLVAATITVKLWPVAIASGLSAAALFAVSRKPKPAGRCVACGYDLARLPAGAKCPECGRIPACAGSA